MDDRAGEQGGAREGQERSGQGEDVGGPAPAPDRRNGAGARPRRPARVIDPPRWWSAAAGTGRRAASGGRHRVPRRGDHIGQDGDHGAGRSGEGGRGRDDPEAGIGGDRPRLQRTLAGTPLDPGRPGSHRGAATCPADRARGPSNWLTEVSRQAATRESVADVARIWTRRKTGHARCTAGPPWAEPQPTSPPTMNHTRVSTPRLWPLPGRAPSQLTHGRERIRCPDAPSTD